MTNEEIRDTWKKFMEEFSNYFKQNEEIWNDNLE